MAISDTLALANTNTMEFKINFWTFLAITVLMIALIEVLSVGIKLEKLRIIEQQTVNEKIGLVFDYNCDGYETHFYNCGNSFRNITGTYCNGTMLCQNKVKHG